MPQVDLGYCTTGTDVDMLEVGDVTVGVVTVGVFGHWKGLEIQCPLYCSHTRLTNQIAKLQVP